MKIEEFEAMIKVYCGDNPGPDDVFVADNFMDYVRRNWIHEAPLMPAKVFVAIDDRAGKLTVQIMATAPVTVVSLLENRRENAVAIVESGDCKVVINPDMFREAVCDSLAFWFQSDEGHELLKQLSPVLK